MLYIILHHLEIDLLILKMIQNNFRIYFQKWIAQSNLQKNEVLGLHLFLVSFVEKSYLTFMFVPAFRSRAESHLTFILSCG